MHSYKSSKLISISFALFSKVQRKRKEFIYIQKSSVAKAKREGLEQGIEQGIEQGLEQGRKEEKIIIAKSLLDILDIETISLKTGLSVDEIEKLKVNL